MKLLQRRSCSIQPVNGPDSGDVLHLEPPATDALLMHCSRLAPFELVQVPFVQEICTTSFTISMGCQESEARVSQLETPHIRSVSTHILKGLRKGCTKLGDYWHLMKHDRTGRFLSVLQYLCSPSLGFSHAHNAPREPRLWTSKLREQQDLWAEKTGFAAKNMNKLIFKGSLGI